MVYVAENVSLGWKIESTFGTAPTTIDDWIGIVTGSPTLNVRNNYSPVHAKRPSGREVFKQLPLKKEVVGSLNIIPQDGYPFYFAMGSSVDTDEGGYYKHVLTTGNSLPSFTIQKAYIDTTVSSYNWVGNMVNKLSCKGDKESHLKLSMDLIGKKPVSLGTSYDTVSSSSKSTYFFDETSEFKLWGTSFARVEGFSLDISNKLRPKYYYNDDNDKWLSEIILGKVEYVLKASIVVDDGEILSELISEQTPFSASIKFERSSTDKLEFAFTDCVLREAQHEIPDEGEIIVPVSITPRTVTVNVYDDIASY